MIPPTELRELKQWHCWQTEHGAKIPKQTNGQNARSNDPNTWSSYDIAAATASQFDGLAFVITPDDPYCGIDLDNCLDEKGRLLDWALPVISRFDGYGFAEISPSKRGIKIVVRANKPPKSRCVYVVNATLKQQIEVYDFGRFWTITGQLYGDNRTIRESQSAVDWLCSGLCLPGAPNNASPLKPQAALVPRHIPCGNATSLEIQAEAYVTSVPPALPGDRNNQAFKLAGNLKALRYVDQNLSEEQITGLVNRWNGTLIEPLGDVELQKCIQSGLTRGTPRDLKEQIVTGVPISDVNLSGILESAHRSDTKYVPNTSAGYAPGGIAQELIENAPGMIGTITRWITDTALYQLPEASLAATLGLLSVLTGRKVEDSLENRTNLYLLTVAKTGAGKEHPRGQIQRAMIEASAEHMLSTEDLGSSPGLAKQLVDEPACLMQIDEFGQLVSAVSSDRAAPHMVDIATTLLKLYTSSNRSWKGKAYADTSKIPLVNQPHLVINGTTTGRILWESLSSQRVDDGLLGRIHFFDVPEYADFCRHRADKIRKQSKSVPHDIVDFIQYWDQFELGGNLSGLNPRPVLMRHSDPAWDRYMEHQEQISQRRHNESERSAAIWSRSAQSACKLGMLSAASKRSMIIEFEDMDWGIKLQNTLTRRLLRRIGQNICDTPYEKDRNRILTKITKEGAIRRAKLNSSMHRIRPRLREEILADLRESEQIGARYEGEGNGRHIVYFSVLPEI